MKYLDQVTATCFLAGSELATTHPNAADNMEALEALGAAVLTGVDATNLGHLFGPLEKQAAGSGGRCAQKFTRIVWNFPQHPERRKIQKQRELMKAFFASAYPLLDNEDMGVGWGADRQKRDGGGGTACGGGGISSGGDGDGGGDAAVDDDEEEEEVVAEEAAQKWCGGGQLWVTLKGGQSGVSEAELPGFKRPFSNTWQVGRTDQMRSDEADQIRSESQAAN
jgi:hypothetical protein